MSTEFAGSAPSEDVVDIDGNRYKTVKIGNQIWMAENLRVLRYNDGTPIEMEGELDWVRLGGERIGARCHYENKPENGERYGALYNWFAVNTGKLAPKGWHVPTDQEWQALSDACGGDKLAGASLKTDKDWNGNNKSGFSALPAGYRYHDGGFRSVGSYVIFWSSTDGGAGLAWGRPLGSGYDFMTPYNAFKKYGCSVRCVKDGP